MFNIALRALDLLDVENFSRRSKNRQQADRFASCETSFVAPRPLFSPPPDSTVIHGGNRDKLLVMAESRLRSLSRKRPSVIAIYSLFISAVYSLLILHIQYSALPGQFIKALRTTDSNNSDLSFIGEQDSPGKGSSISIPTVHSETEAMDDINLLPIMNFKDLGSRKKKVLLLIIVTTAPQRFDRRQAIRDTWWKHCTGNQVSDYCDTGRGYTTLGLVIGKIAGVLIYLGITVTRTTEIQNSQHCSNRSHLNLLQQQSACKLGILE